MTKKTIKMKDIILEHYQKVHELDMHGLTVRVWKPRTMQQLPAYNMLTVIDEYAENAEHWCATENKAEWFYGNPDWGMWDALIVRYVDPRRKTLDIYVAAILVRPFSREAYDWYNRHHVGLEQVERLILMWDSREYDRIHGFDTSYGRPGNMKEWKDRLYAAEDEERDIVDESPDCYSDDHENESRRCVKFRIEDGEIHYNAVVGDDEKMTDHATDLMRDAAKAFYEFREKHQEVTEMHFYTNDEVQVNN